VDCRVPIVRLRIEDIPLSDDLRYYLSTPHWLDALTQPLSKHIPPLIAAIRELLGPPPAENETAAIAPQPPSVEVAPKQRTVSVGQTSPGKRVPLAIGVVVVLVIGLIVARYFWLLKRLNPVAPPLQQIASPLPSPTIVPVVPTQPAATPPTAVPATPSPSPAEITPTPEAKPSPSPTKPNKKEPSPRNNRAWQVWIDEFVHNFIASNETNDLDLSVSFYAPNVELFEEGKKSTEAIRSDVESYNARWPSRRATIRGDVRLSEKTPNHNYTASFEHDYYVENASRGEWINGAVAVDLQITIDGDGIPRIVSMKQKTLRKDKGTMQKR
jgi:flagellar basal body-associated protein FliL